MPLLSLATNFPSRIGRAQWWLGIAAIGAVISGALALGGDHNALLMLGAATVSLAIFIPISIARLHDRNRSAGNTFYCAMAILLGAKIFRNILPADHHLSAILILGAILATVAAIELGCLRGTVGLNPYGEDPLEDRTETA
jgi:uncharacterized membrane protein YhaH (DUF805 family)